MKKKRSNEVNSCKFQYLEYEGVLDCVSLEKKHLHCFLYILVKLIPAFLKHPVYTHNIIVIQPPPPPPARSSKVSSAMLDAVSDFVRQMRSKGLMTREEGETWRGGFSGRM